MSHVTTVDIEIKDLEALKEACEKIGLVLNRDQKNYKWFGRHVGDYPLPEGFSKEDLGKCDHAISIPNNSMAYEIGVIKQDHKYTLLWDFWNHGYGMESHVGENCKKLVAAYAQTVALKEATKFANAEGWSINYEHDCETDETTIRLRKF